MSTIEETAVENDTPPTFEAFAHMFPDSGPAPEAAAEPDAPEPKPRPKAKKPKVVPTPADPANTTGALEKIHATNGAQARLSLRTTVGRLDAIMRDTTPPKPYNPHLSPPPPAWLKRPGLVLRSRVGALARLRWLDRRAEGIRETFVDPNPAELLRQFTESARFSSLERLGMIAVGHFGPGATGPAEARALSTLNSIRIRMGQMVETSYLGSVERLASFKTWGTIEAKLAILRDREAVAVAKLDRIRSMTNPFIRAVVSRIQPALDDVGLDVLAKSVFLAREPEKATPPTTNRAIVQAEGQIAAVYSATTSTGPLTPERAALLEEIRRPLDEVIRRNREDLVHGHASDWAPHVAAIRDEVLHWTRSPAGWRKLGELADMQPRAFPVGFADRWLAVVAEAMGSVDEALMLEVIDAA